MQCICCKGNVEAGQAICPVCGIPLLAGNDSEAMQEFIQNYKKKKLEPISIFLKIYHYSCADGKLTDDGEEYIKLADVAELEQGQFLWSSSSYEEIVSDTPFTLTVRIQNGDKQTEKELSITPEKAISHEMIGVVLGDGFTLCIAVGDMENYTLSETIELMQS